MYAKSIAKRPTFPTFCHLKPQTSIQFRKLIIYAFVLNKSDNEACFYFHSGHPKLYFERFYLYRTATLFIDVFISFSYQGFENVIHSVLKK